MEISENIDTDRIVIPEELHTCAICLNPIIESEIPFQACINSHIFHFACFYQYQSRINLIPCPLCRTLCDGIPNLTITLLGKQTDLISYRIVQYVSSLTTKLDPLWYGLRIDTTNQTEFLKFLCIKAYIRDFDGDFFVQEGLLASCWTFFQTMTVLYYEYCIEISRIYDLYPIHIFNRRINNEKINSPYSDLMIRRYKQNSLNTYAKYYHTSPEWFKIWSYLVN